MDTHGGGAAKKMIRHYRDWDANHKGVTSQEFWEICQEVGIDVPRQDPATQKVKAS